MGLEEIKIDFRSNLGFNLSHPLKYSFKIKKVSTEPCTLRLEDHALWCRRGVVTCARHETKANDISCVGRVSMRYVKAVERGYLRVLAYANSEVRGRKSGGG